MYPHLATLQQVVVVLQTKPMLSKKHVVQPIAVLPVPDVTHLIMVPTTVPPGILAMDMATVHTILVGTRIG